MLVYVSCGQYDRAVTLLNNMRRVDLAALLLEACLEAQVLTSSNLDGSTSTADQAPASELSAAHRSVYSSYSRHLIDLGFTVAAKWYADNRAASAPAGDSSA